VSDIQERLLAAFQVEHREHLQAVRRMLDDLARSGFDAAGFDFVEAHRRVHTLKGAARAVGLRPIEALAHRLESVMSRCQSGEVALDREVAGVVQLAFDRIEDFVAQLAQTAEPPEPTDALSSLDQWLAAGVQAERDGAASSHHPVAHRSDGTAQRSAAVPAIETTRVEVGALDSALGRAGEVLSEATHHDRIAGELREIRQALESLAGDPRAAQVRPEIAALLARTRSIGRLQGDAAWRLGRLGRELHRDVGALRMVPASGVFDGMARMVRDLAQADDKRVDFSMFGLDAQADRQVLQRLKDPVMHLLRNAVSHGIEPSDERRRRGKPAEGRISLSLSTQGGQLEVCVADDGRGLDRARIVQEAARRGLLRDGAEAPSDTEALTQLLLQPGFTTARTVTEVAGRGIGLSVVDKAIRQLRGGFVLSPASPAGTVAKIRVPLPVAGSRVLLVRSAQHAFAIPAAAVRSLRRVSVSDITTVGGASAVVASDGGEPMPLVRLADLLEHTNPPPAGDGDMPVVILAAGSTPLAMAVDALVAVRDSVIHDLDPVVAGQGLAAGAVMLADGAVAILLNPAALAQAARRSEARWSLEAQGAARSKEAPLVLVVDDSITTRTLEKSIFEARGFRVCLSVDGVDALEQLRQQRPNVVIADIEMPRMDGFELLHAMKGDRNLSDIPVVLVTSRDDPQDRLKGLALGAEAYIVKQRFDQTELLQAIEQIV